ncbi:MAG: cation diffusion facilitator family transporter [Lachnospiraceae bacterium]|nr:cation diffusion facilitator family transporter [Lachnospiraceae bacterium]MDY5742421.1 cation diffusion facilitator family transporter [Lachnospiraceae bacterium]
MQENQIQDRGKRLQRISGYGIAANVFLFIIKAVIGLWGGSMAVVADAFNNLSDSTASVIGLIGAYFSGKPADAEHPYGHGRIEYISAFVVAFLVLQMGFSLFRGSIGRLLEPQPLLVTPLMLAVLLASMLIKVWLWRVNTIAGRQLDSKVCTATGADALSDVWVTLATVVSLAVVFFWKLNIDGWMGLIVSLLVMKNGIMLAIETLQPLIGEPVEPAYYQSIEDFVTGYPDIDGCHDLLIHNYGAGQNIASIHAEVRNTMTMEEAHVLADRIERDIARAMGLLLVIHIDPTMPPTALTIERQQWLMGLLTEIDGQISMHDFRMVEGDNGFTYLFDIVLPYRYLPEQEETVLQQLVEAIQRQRPGDHCIVKIDRSYTGNSQN